MSRPMLLATLTALVAFVGACAESMPRGPGGGAGTVVPTPAPDAQQPTPPLATAPLLSSSDGKGRGSVAIRGAQAGPNSAVVAVEVIGLSLRGEYAVLLRAGSCAQPSASAGRLGTVTPDLSGTAQLLATHVRAGATGTEMLLTAGLVGDGNHLVELLDNAGATVACADLPALQVGAPPALPQGPTGDQRLDALVVAVRAGDVRTLEAAVAFPRIPCVAPPVQGAGGPPRCAATEGPGTPVEVLPAAGCEGYYLRPGEVPSTLAAFIEGGPALRSWHRPTDALRFFGQSTHVLLFELFDTRLARMAGRELIVADGAITGIHLGCGQSPDELATLQRLGAPLPPGQAPAGGAAGSTPLFGRTVLGAVNGSGVLAAVRFEADSLSSPADVSVEASLDPGMSYVVHVHGGTCDAPSASLRAVGMMSADAQGRAAIRARLNGTAETPALSLEALADGSRIIDIHGHQGGVVACGVVPPIEQR